MAIVVRCWGLHYDWGTEEHPGPGEVWNLGWLTKDGGVVCDRRRAMEYATEADAWMHLAATGNIGHDEEHGDWSFVEVEGRLL